ncbi:FtsB family cell division protein [Phaeocystidibacter marisrubri]|uniref:Septum formation initiator family protein n=1 Tax=Phaeocystidibacter marisrubri TaxID=1577780 RepID=A0A6L3ZGZ7_9FLAO|nr:septum formation initiator family protein [Phaeocystidibacter marisrubri]KAB2817134.1 septum formation initiator family protein [Phaeocystidibacter marisrubri]GGH76718.1 hypothetical protein GCM10011318_25400 [Phaeocystidibacter marisrubri]
MLKKWRKKRWFKMLSNKYVLATIVFVVWISFLDRNSFLLHRELNKQIEALEQGKTNYQSDLEQNKRELEELESDPEKLEKFAREQYWMHKEGEEVFLIETEEE